MEIRDDRQNSIMWDFTENGNIMMDEPNFYTCVGGGKFIKKLFIEN